MNSQPSVVRCSLFNVRFQLLTCFHSVKCGHGSIGRVRAVAALRRYSTAVFS